jgi:chaperonin GroES
MLKMLRDRVMVKPIERKASQIIETVLHERFNLGEVIAVGPGKLSKRGNPIPLDVKPGDIVRYGEFQFPEYREAGIKYQILQEADIAAIVE